MNYNMNPSDISLKIVNAVRENILEMLEYLKEDGDDHIDSWTEGVEGVGWLDNEVMMATELMKIIWTNKTKKIEKWEEWEEWEECKTVVDFQEKMASFFSLDELRFISFVIECGGSDEEMLFELRETDRKTIKDWFKQKGFIFKYSECSVCHKIGEMKKCAGCAGKGLSTYYCSKECQKIDWKNSHKYSCDGKE
jgi:hypothetical protein